MTANGNTSYGTTVSGAYSMLSLTNSTITTSGGFAYGLAVDIGGTTVGSNITVNSTGMGAVVTNGSSLSLTDSTITASGGNAIVTRGGQMGNINTIMVDGGSLYSPTADLIMATTAVSNITLTTVTTAASGSNNLLSIVNDSTIHFIAEQNSNLTGNIIADMNSVANIAFNNSLFTGAINGRQIHTTLDTSTWNVAADSIMATLSNIGAINFSPAGNFKTVSVTNSYTGGGSIIFNTHLNEGGTASMTDTLVADSTAGNTILLVNNKGGLGALTGNGPTDGIKLINVTGGAAASNGLFVLGKPVIAGPYEYTLSKSDSINWYLKSTLDVVVDAKSPQKSVIPNYRQETSLYSTLPSMAALYGRTLLDTLDERTGVQPILASFSGDAKVVPSAFWGRVLGEHGLHNGGNNGIYSKAGARFNYNIGGMQAGFDLYRNEGKDYAGLYGAVGQINGDVTHFTSMKAGWNRLDAYTTGGYWTHYGMAG